MPNDWVYLAVAFTLIIVGAFVVGMLVVGVMKDGGE